MKHALWMLLLCAFARCPRIYAASCPTNQPKDENALVEIEKTWAQALEQHDANTLTCILADEFEDTATDGQLSDRATVLGRAQKQPGSQHQLSDMHARIYGNVGYIRGIATALTAGGRPKVVVRFTDVYVYRDGRWQCVAGHESQFPLVHN
jgi:hypothetical protein